MAGINVGGIYSELVLKADKFYTGLKQASQETTNFENKLKGMSSKATSAGKTLTTKLTAPIIGVGTAATLLGINFDAGMSEVQAISGATGQDMVKLENLAREMGATTKFSAKDAAEGLKYMALAGWDTQQMAAGLEPALILAGAAGMELGLATDIVTDTMSMFGMKAEEATKMTDMLAYAQANSNTDVMMLGEALKYSGAAANAMGYDLADTAALLGIFADQGLKGSAAGTTLNAMFRDMKENSEKGAIAIGKSNIKIVDANGNYRDMADILADVEDATKDMTMAEKDAALSKIWGTQAIKGVNMALEAGTDKLKSFEDGIRNSDGASKDMYDTMQDNLKGSIDNIKSALEEAGLSIYNVMLPSLESLADKIQSAVDWFNNLDESTQRNIVVFGGAVAAIGPLLLIVGSLSGAILKTVGVAKMLSGGFAALTGASAATGAAVAGATAPTWALGGAMKAGALLMNPWVVGAGLVAGGAYLIHKRLKEDAIPEVDRFGDAVSENTQEAVGNFMDMTEQADIQLKELSWSQQHVTSEMAEDMKTKQQEITTTLLTAIEERHTQEIEETQNQFRYLNTLDGEQKNKIIESINDRYEVERMTTENGHQRINEIIEKAHQEGRKIYDHEAKEILQIRENMTEQSVKIMSENEVEQRVILENMKRNSEIITAKEAAEVVKNSKKKKNDVIKEANDQYDETVAWAIRQRDEMGTLSDQEAEDVIASAEKRREEVIAEAENMHKDVVKEAKAQAGEHVNEVDWETGEVKSKWKVMKGDISKKAKDTKDNVIKYAKEKATQFGNKVEEMKTAASTKWENIRSDASGKFSKIKGFVDNNINPASSNWGKKVSDMATKASSKFSSAKTAAETAFSKIKTAIQGGIDKITSWNAKKVKDKVATFTQKVKTVGSKIIGGLIGNNAHGTEYWRGGLTWVGEQGRELVYLPQGSKVYSNQKSEQMVAEGVGFTGSVTLTVPVTIDGREVARATGTYTAEELQRLQDRQRRGR